MSNEKKDSVNRKSKQSKKQKVIFSLYIYAFIFVFISIIYFLSPLSYVSKVTVNGNENVSSEEIIDLSEITNETRYWSKDFEEKAEMIKKNIKEIAKVEIKRNFINDVQINVQEYKRVAFMLKDHKGYPVLSNGTVLSREGQGNVGDLPLLLNWVEGEELKGMARELANTSKDGLEMISEIYYSPTDINPLHISVYMTDGYEVSGTIPGFSSKISEYPSVSAKIPEGVKGVIDIEVGYVLKPYDESSEPSGKE